MTKLRLWTTLGLTIALGLACGDDDKTPPSNPGQPGQPSTVSISIPSGAMSLGMNAFLPNPAQVQPGDLVTWTNNDSVPHTVTSDVGRFDSDNLAPGQSFSWTVPQDTGGSQMDYHCELHPSMRGSLVMSGGTGTGTGVTQEIPN